MSKLDEKAEATLVHDINATLSSLLSALELVNEEWRTNPELVDRILPLTEQKLSLLREQLRLFRQTPQ